MTARKIGRYPLSRATHLTPPITTAHNMNLSTVFQYLFLLTFAHAAERHASSSSSSSDEGSHPPSTGNEPPVLKIRAQKQRPTSKESSWMAKAREAQEAIFRALQLLLGAIEKTKTHKGKYQSAVNHHLSRAKTLVGSEKIKALMEASDSKNIVNGVSKRLKDLDCALLLHDILASGYDMEISDNKIIKGLSRIAVELENDKQSTTLKDWERELNKLDSKSLQKARFARDEIKQAMKMYFNNHKDKITSFLEAEKHLKAALETNNGADIKSAKSKMSDVEDFNWEVYIFNRFKTLLRMIDRTNNEGEILNDKDINKALRLTGIMLKTVGEPTALYSWHETLETARKEENRAKDAADKEAADKKAADKKDKEAKEAKEAENRRLDRENDERLRRQNKQNSSRVRNRY